MSALRRGICLELPGQEREEKTETMLAPPPESRKPARVKPVRAEAPQPPPPPSTRPKDFSFVPAVPSRPSPPAQTNCHDPFGWLKDSRPSVTRALLKIGGGILLFIFGPVMLFGGGGVFGELPAFTLLLFPAYWVGRWLDKKFSGAGCRNRS